MFLYIYLVERHAEIVANSARELGFRLVSSYPDGRSTVDLLGNRTFSGDKRELGVVGKGTACRAFDLS